MHTRIRELLDHLETHQAALLAAVDRVPPALRDARPGPDRWSVADVIQHVAKVNGLIAQTVADRVAAARAEGVGPDPDTSPLLPMFDDAPIVDRTTQITAPPVVRPDEALSAAGALDRFRAANAALAASVQAADGVDLSVVMIQHPVFGPRSLYWRIAFAGWHVARHTAQISETSRELAAASGSA